MANPFNCTPCIDCPGTDSPVINFSSEAPDHDVFISMAWGPIDNDEQDPTINQTWTDTGCVATCSSAISQEDADLCALLQASQCAIGKRQNTDNTFPPVFQNGVQFCNSKCPDGSLFTYTVAAGTFMALSQLLADEKAASFACTKARQHRICFGSLTTLACVGTPYSSTIVLTGGADDPTFNFWDVSTGDSSLPPGLSFSAGFSATGVTLSGTPTKGGTYNFTVRMTTLSGDFMEKAYTICVANIQPDSLPSGTTGLAYSQSLTESNGCLPTPLAWTVASGSLPPGLTFAPSGTITGTPTTPGDYTFTVKKTSGSNSCSKKYSIHVAVGDPCGDSQTVLHSADAMAYYALCGGAPIDQFLTGVPPGPPFNDWISPAGSTPIFLTAGINANVGVQVLQIVLLDQHNLNVQYSKAVIDGCIIGTYSNPVIVPNGPDPNPPLPTPPATLHVTL